MPQHHLPAKPQSLSILQDQSTVSLIQKALYLGDFDVSSFDHARNLPGFQELLENPSAESVSAALDDSSEVGESKISSSVRIDGIRSLPAEIATALSRPTSLRGICLLQNPTHESDALSSQVFAELATRTGVSSSVNVVFAGAHLSALRKRFWLPTSLGSTPLNTFPIQQILARCRRGDGRPINFEYNNICLGDGLLKPEHFAAGFLLWLSTLEPKSHWWFEEKTPFFALSSAPASLTPDLLSTAQVTPILGEKEKQVLNLTIH
ncbi:hypothetical protein F4824DRAFT_503551 [Ustulina deusta]|nr:hypothetical protein F4824DRAFT_503551 [Ustulina deusta]